MLVLATAPALTPTAVFRTFEYWRDLAMANWGLYYIHSAVLSIRFMWLWKWLDERIVNQRVVHDGYIVEGLRTPSVHVVYHSLRGILKGKAVTSATRPRTCPWVAIFVPSLTTWRAVILQSYRLLSLTGVFHFYLYRGQTVILNLWIEHLLLCCRYAQLSFLIRLALHVGIAHQQVFRLAMLDIIRDS